MSTSLSPLVQAAQALAVRVLVDEPRRLDHVRGAGMIAGMAAGALRVKDADTVVAAAFLHDIGYAAKIAHTGFHPLDGALFLAREGWPDAIVLLVAHHSQAAILAPYYGVEHHMSLMEHAHGVADDIITFSDLRSGLNGLGADARERVADMRQRHADRAFVPPDVREDRYRRLLTSASRINASVARAMQASPSRLSAQAS